MTQNYKILGKIGEGSYGKVYKVEETETGNIYALKQIRHTRVGISSLLETTVMASIRHPNINHAVSIFSTADNLNIVQELGQWDMFDACAHKNFDLEMTRKFCFQIAHAVYCLHRLGIIHGDLKGRNVLYFSDDDIRLIDFNLSVKMWNPGDKFTQAVGTHSHSPPEMLIGSSWGRPLDIWSLGCLFYEFIFGKLLMPSQPRPPNATRKDIKAKYYRSIRHWLLSDSEITDSFNPVRLDPRLNEREFSNLKDLLHKMLRFKELDRIKITQVLDHPFFRSFTRPQLNLRIVEYEPFVGQQLDHVNISTRKILYPAQNRGNLNRYDVNHLHRIAVSIYQHVRSLVPEKTLTKPNIYLATSCWLASKLVLGTPPPIGGSYRTHQIVECEKEICHHLSYILPIIDQSTIAMFAR